MTHRRAAADFTTGISARYVIGQETFAGRSGNGREAPKADIGVSNGAAGLDSSARGSSENAVYLRLTSGWVSTRSRVQLLASGEWRARRPG